MKGFTKTYKLPHPEAKPPKLDPEKVPEPLRCLIPLAEKYGISDDVYRDDILETLDESELKECAFAFLDCDDETLDDWLAGPEADGPELSDEYICFTALTMAMDMAKELLEKRK